MIVLALAFYERLWIVEALQTNILTGTLVLQQWIRGFALTHEQIMFVMLSFF